MASPMIPLDSAAGQILAQEADCFQPQLVSVFSKQTGPSFCALQTLALIILANSYRSEDADRDEYSEDGMFNLEAVTEVAGSPGDVNGVGITLDEIEEILKGLSNSTSCPGRVGQIVRSYDVHHAEPSGVSKFRRSASEALARSDSSEAVVVNFDKAALGVGRSGGHFSPLAGYHQGQDRFLLMDVRRGAVEGWVKTEDIFNAMLTEDPFSKISRGYSIVHFV